MGASQPSPLAHPRSRNPVAYDTPSPSPPSSANTQASFAYASSPRMMDPQSTSQSFAQAGAYYGLAPSSLQNHGSSSQSYYNSQVDTGSGASSAHVRSDSSLEMPNRFVPMHVMSSYERDRGASASRKDKEYARGRGRAMPPTPLSAEMRYGGASRSMMPVDGEADMRRARDRGELPW